jgi:hypothetical protein
MRQLYCLQNLSLALIAFLLAGGVSAQETRPQLRPSPQEADKYRDFCRERPAECTGSFERDRDRLLLQDLDRQRDAARRNELIRQLGAPR